MFEVDYNDNTFGGNVHVDLYSILRTHFLSDLRVDKIHQIQSTVNLLLNTKSLPFTEI